MDATAPGPTTAARGAFWSLALLLAINLFNYIDRYILAAVEPLVRAEFFAPDSPNAKFWTGSLATVFLVAYFVTAPLFGLLADRRGRWAIIGIAVIVWSLASGGSGLATAFWMLMVCRIVIGLGEAAYGPTAPTLISDMYPVERRGTVLAWFYMAIPVGSAIGYGVGGLIGKHWGWHSAFLVTIPPGVLLGILCFMRPEPQRGQADGVGHTRPRLRWRDYALLWRTRSFVINCAAMTAMTFAIGGLSFWMPTYIHEVRKAGELDSVNLVFGGLLVVMGLAATLLGGWLGDRLRTRLRGAYFWVSGVGMLAGFPAFLGILYLPFPYAWIAVGVSVFCLFLNTGPANTALANVTHPAMRASAYAVNIFIIHALGDAISPPLIGWIADRSGMTTGFLIVGFMFVVSGALWIYGARHLDDDTRAAPTRLE